MSAAAPASLAARVLPQRTVEALGRRLVALRLRLTDESSAARRRLDQALPEDGWADAVPAPSTWRDLAMVERCLGSLADTDAALDRLADGTYGQCVHCGDDIALPRLLAAPQTSRCSAC